LLKPFGIKSDISSGIFFIVRSVIPRTSKKNELD